MRGSPASTTAAAVRGGSSGCPRGGSRLGGNEWRAREVELLGLPWPQAFLELFGIHGWIARGAKRITNQNSGGLMRAVSAAALNVHGDDYVGTKGSPQADVIANDIFTAPLGDDFLGIEGVAVVDGAREILLGAIDTMRGEQLGSAQHGDIAEQFRSDFVLAAVAAIILDIDDAQTLAVPEVGEERIGFVVGVGGRLQKSTGDAELAERESKRDMAAAGGGLRERHAVLRVNRRRTRDHGEYRGR